MRQPYLFFDPKANSRVALVNVTGGERTEPEFRQLLAAGGFTLVAARILPSGLGIVEGLPV